MRLWSFLLLLFLPYSQTLKYCRPTPATTISSPANFVFLFDTAYSRQNLEKWKQIAVQMSCILPVHENIRLAVAVKQGNTIEVKGWKGSDRFIAEIKPITGKGTPLRCPHLGESIVKELGKMDGETHFLIPMDSELDCDLKKGFLDVSSTFKNVKLDEVVMGKERRTEFTRIHMQWDDIPFSENDEDVPDNAVLGAFSPKEANLAEQIRGWAESLPKPLEQTFSTTESIESVKHSTGTANEKSSGFVENGDLSRSMTTQEPSSSTTMSSGMSSTVRLSSEASTSKEEATSHVIPIVLNESRTSSPAGLSRSTATEALGDKVEKTTTASDAMDSETSPEGETRSSSVAGSSRRTTVGAEGSWRTTASENDLLGSETSSSTNDWETSAPATMATSSSEESSTSSAAPSFSASTEGSRSSSTASNKTTIKPRTPSAVGTTESSSTEGARPNGAVEEEQSDWNGTRTASTAGSSRSSTTEARGSSGEGIGMEDMNSTVISVKGGTSSKGSSSTRSSTAATTATSAGRNESDWELFESSSMGLELSETTGEEEMAGNTTETLERTSEARNATEGNGTVMSVWDEENVQTHTTTQTMTATPKGEGNQEEYVKHTTVTGENRSSRDPLQNVNISGNQWLNVTFPEGVVKINSDAEVTTEAEEEKAWYAVLGGWLSEKWLFVLIVGVASILLIVGILLFVSGRRGIIVERERRREVKKYKKLGGDMWTAREPSPSWMEEHAEENGEGEKLLPEKSQKSMEPSSISVPVKENQQPSSTAENLPPIPHPAEGAEDPYSPVFPSYIEGRFSEIAVTPLETRSSATSRRPLATGKKKNVLKSLKEMNINDM